MSRRKRRLNAGQSNLPAEQPQRAPEAPAKQEELFQTEEVVEFFSASFTGPLPIPTLLREYDNVLPGLAERIVAMAEDEGEARRSLASRSMRLSEWGLISAVVITLFIVASAVYAALHGAE